ncbi:MAG: cyclic nucleotide-binding domain-containing protein, partial [Akkermansiaceae bacterium]|nr:cyclic nucleotide-binding domain-containing protein [Akkermansiaceae bacterium]
QGKVEVVRGGIRIALVEEPGAVLGEISVLLDRPHMAEVRAMGKAFFYVARDAERFLNEHPAVNLHIACTLAKRVDALGCYLADLKQQYADDESHLGMVGEVLDSLMLFRH